MMSSGRRLAAELLGTAMLVATVVGSGIMAERLTDNQALVLLANALPTAAILVVIITILAPVSGAHFNPVVTLNAMLRRELTVAVGIGYLASQILGGISGTIVAQAMFAEPLFQFSQHVRTGPSQWLSEAVAAFGLVLTIMLAGKWRRQAVPALVGLYIGAAYWFTASTSFANPAVTLARSLTNSFSGIHPDSVPMFVIAQFAGGVLGMLVATWLTGTSTVSKAGPG